MSCRPVTVPAMNQSDTPIPLESGCAVRLSIALAPDRGGEWDRQLELIKSTGAEYEDYAWYLWIDEPVLTARHLEPLWRSVAEYGTSVKIDRIKPPARV